MEQSSLAYLVWLVHILSPGNRNIIPLICHFGSAEDVFMANEQQLKNCGLLTSEHIDKLLSQNTLSIIEPVIDYCENNDVCMITYWDEDYPQNLKTMYDPPALLFCLGRPVWKESILSIAVAGTRSMTSYGRKMTEAIVTDLAEVNCTIIGGMSDGVDACAHKAALACKGKTIAVLPCGIDVIYPQSQYNLYWDIAENSCILSEFLPGTRPLGSNFQPRNRLIAGLSDGVLHVQSPEKSGSLITTKWALQYNRDVFAIPGDADVRQSEGPNGLIQSGAKLVTSAWDILSDYGYLFANIKPNDELAKESAAMPDDEKMRAVIQVLLQEELDMTGISLKTGMDLTNVILLLTEMQIRGIITEKPGGLYGLAKTFTV